MKKKLSILMVLVLAVCMLGGCGSNNTKSETDKVPSKYKNDQKVSLILNETTATLYLPKKNIAQVMAVQSNDERKPINEKNYDFLKEKKICQIGISSDSNVLAQYQLTSGQYSKEGLSQLGKVKTLNKKYLYASKKVNDKYVYYISVPGNKKFSILLIMESFEKLDDKTLISYADRVVSVKTTKLDAE